MREPRPDRRRPQPAPRRRHGRDRRAQRAGDPRLLRGGPRAAELAGRGRAAPCAAWETSSREGTSVRALPVPPPLRLVSPRLVRRGRGRRGASGALLRARARAGALRRRQRARLRRALPAPRRAPRARRAHRGRHLALPVPRLGLRRRRPLHGRALRAAHPAGGAPAPLAHPRARGPRAGVVSPEGRRPELRRARSARALLPGLDARRAARVGGALGAPGDGREQRRPGALPLRPRHRDRGRDGARRRRARAAHRVEEPGRDAAGQRRRAASTSTATASATG